MKSLLALMLAIILLGCAEEETEIREKDVNQNFLNPQLAVFKDGEVWKAQVTFTLPNPCYKINYTGKDVQDNAIFLKFKYIPPSPGEICIQVIQKYNKTIELEELSKGNYRVVVQLNNSVVKSMQITI